MLDNQRSRQKTVYFTYQLLKPKKQTQKQTTKTKWYWLKQTEKSEKANLNVNVDQQSTVRVARKCVHITVRYWSTQYSTEQFW